MSIIVYYLSSVCFSSTLLIDLVIRNVLPVLWMSFSNGPYGGVTLLQQPRCNVVHRLTPPLRTLAASCYGCAGANTRRVLLARVPGPEYGMCRCLVRLL